MNKRCIFLLLLGLLSIRPLAFAGAQLQASEVPDTFVGGYKKYVAMCAKCHGEWGDGSDEGPPLMHPFYLPSHHSDKAFYRAILKGSVQHHWEFGDMPPVAGASKEDAQHITAYVRWLQRYTGLKRRH